MMKNKNTWAWKCNGQDNDHGCYHPDYEGECTARGFGFASESEAKEDAKKHRCRFHGKVTISQIPLVSSPAVVIRRTSGKTFSAKHYASVVKELAIQLDKHNDYEVEIQHVEKPEGW